jgi:hypothetical protein
VIELRDFGGLECRVWVARVHDAARRREDRDGIRLRRAIVRVLL